MKSLLERLNESGSVDKYKDELRDKVKYLLLKRGNRADDVDAMIKQEFDSAIKSYPEAKASFIADVVRTLY